MLTPSLNVEESLEIVDLPGITLAISVVGLMRERSDALASGSCSLFNNTQISTGVSYTYSQLVFIYLFIFLVLAGNVLYFCAFCKIEEVKRQKKPEDRTKASPYWKKNPSHQT